MNLEFETAARLRDEIKRLKETELAIADDPLARQSAIDERTGGYRGERKYGNAANLPPEPATRARKNDLDEMTVKRTEVPVATRARKPHLDEMGASSNMTSVAADEHERPQRPDPMTTNHRPGGRSVGGRAGSSAGRKGPKR
jgi:excinuclease ABC subunit B